eukprot:3789020-Alexandrium_andersonii.AAC.1
MRARGSTRAHSLGGRHRVRAGSDCWQALARARGRSAGGWPTEPLRGAPDVFFGAFLGAGLGRSGMFLGRSGALPRAV